MFISNELNYLLHIDFITCGAQNVSFIEDVNITQLLGLSAQSL